VAHLWRNRRKTAPTYRTHSTEVVAQITNHAGASLYVPIPSLPPSKPVLLSLSPSSTVAKCRRWALLGVRPSTPPSRAATVGLRSPLRNSLAFPISQDYMYTPRMTLSIANRCRATLEKLLSTVPSRKTAPVYRLLPEIELALASGWTRKEVWESLSSDGLEVSYKTFNTIIRRARKKPRATASRNWGKETGSPGCAQLQQGDVLNSDGHDPLVNLKRLEQNRPGFHWKGTNSQRTVMNRREEANDKIER
jgi:hypothetical protein